VSPCSLRWGYVKRCTEFPQLPFPQTSRPDGLTLKHHQLSAERLHCTCIRSFTHLYCPHGYIVYFGPLSQFPGPKLAAATLWYEFYYDVIFQGRYIFKIKDLHQKYGMRRPMSLNKWLIESLGPIIRISPNELHIDQPDYYEKLYSQHEPRDKSEYYLSQFQLPASSFWNGRSQTPPNTTRCVP
jgi:hypothetical protein